MLTRLLKKKHCRRVPFSKQTPISGCFPTSIVTQLFKYIKHGLSGSTLKLFFVYSGTHVITYIASTCQERLSPLSRFHPCRAPSRAHVREGAAGLGGEKRQNIFKSGFKIYFSFCVENGLFSASCHLSRPENGAKVQNRVGFGVF